MNNVEDVFNYMFLFKTNEMISQLLNHIYIILQRTPISFQDDVNYKIRRYLVFQYF